jgi:hypothetical protein
MHVLTYFTTSLRKIPVYKQPAITSNHGLSRPKFAEDSASDCDHQDNLPIRVRIPRPLAGSQYFIIGSPQGLKICEIPGFQGVIRGR